MKLSNKALMAISFSMFMTGCSLSMEDCDPRIDPGFLTKLGCATTGTYGERISYKEEQVEALRQSNQDLQDQMTKIMQDKSLLDDDLDTRRKKLEDVQAKLKAMKKNLNNKGALNKKVEAELNQLNTSIEELKNLPEDSVVLEKQAMLDQVQSDYDDALSALAVE